MTITSRSAGRLWVARRTDWTPGSPTGVGATIAAARADLINQEQQT